MNQRVSDAMRAALFGAALVISALAVTAIAGAFQPAAADPWAKELHIEETIKALAERHGLIPRPTPRQCYAKWWTAPGVQDVEKAIRLKRLRTCYANVYDERPYAQYHAAQYRAELQRQGWPFAAAIILVGTIGIVGVSWQMWTGAEDRGTYRLHFGDAGRPSPGKPRPSIRPEPHVPDAGSLWTLGVRWPCTRQELESAYRRRIKAAHPDHGGNTAQFLRVREAYQHLHPLVMS
jgi:hypothetical protein